MSSRQRSRSLILQMNSHRWLLKALNIQIICTQNPVACLWLVLNFLIKSWHKPLSLTDDHADNSGAYGKSLGYGKAIILKSIRSDTSRLSWVKSGIFFNMSRKLQNKMFSSYVIIFHITNKLLVQYIFNRNLTL